MQLFWIFTRLWANQIFAALSHNCHIALPSLPYCANLGDNKPGVSGMPVWNNQEKPIRES